ncbi:MAG: hypothetical protein KAS32_30230 [Candidatus Peribacteraceae bacterium]|nr:hypothetical protein [Candidatus Peribacteraceae bacterium]
MSISIRTENRFKTWNVRIDAGKKYVVTKWDNTPEMVLLRIELNASEKSVLNPNLCRKLVNNLPPFEFMMNEELRKCKHLHGVGVPHSDRIIFTDCIMIHPKYTKGNIAMYQFSNVEHVYERVYLFYGGDKIITLSITLDSELFKVLYSTLEIDTLPPLD